MAKTKEQKIKSIEEGKKDLKNSETVVLLDFTGLSVNKMNEFRKKVREAGSVFKVVKKRLLKFVFESAGIEFDPKKFEGQTGVLYSPKDVQEASSLVYKFSKEEGNVLKILGGFNIREREFIDKELVLKLGSLPSREFLLSQLVGMILAPMKMLMNVLEQKSKMVEKAD